MSKYRIRDNDPGIFGLLFLPFLWFSSTTYYLQKRKWYWFGWETIEKGSRAHIYSMYASLNYKIDLPEEITTKKGWEYRLRLEEFLDGKWRGYYKSEGGYILGKVIIIGIDLQDCMTQLSKRCVIKSGKRSNLF